MPGSGKFIGRSSSLPAGGGISRSNSDGSLFKKGKKTSSAKESRPIPPVTLDSKSLSPTSFLGPSQVKVVPYENPVDLKAKAIENPIKVESYVVVTPEYSTFLDKESLVVIEDVIKSSLTSIIENSDLSLDKFVGKNEDLKSYFESKYGSLDLKGNEVKLDSNKLFEILCNSTERPKIEHRVALTEKGQEQIQVAFSLHDKDLRKPLFDSLDKYKFERHFITATLAGSSTIDINRLGVDKSLPIKDLNKNFETYFPKAENRSIIVSDFDETLTPKKKDEGMLDETKEVLIQYLEVGGKLAISTGSPAETLIPIPSASAKPRFLNGSHLDEKLKPLLNNVVIYANGGATCYLWNKDTQKFENQDSYMKNACQLNNEDFNTSTSDPLLALVIGDGFPGNDQSHAAMASALRGEMSYINVGDKDFAKQETKIEFLNSETGGPTYQEVIDSEGNPIYVESPPANIAANLRKLPGNNSSAESILSIVTETIIDKETLPSAATVVEKIKKSQSEPI